MYVQYFFSSTSVGDWNCQNAIKPAWSQECVVYDVRSICCAYHHHTSEIFKAIHFSQQLAYDSLGYMCITTVASRPPGFNLTFVPPRLSG